MPNMGPFDVLPPGKKAVENKTTGKWELVDMSADNVEDLQALLDESKALLKKSEGVVEELQQQIKMLKKENESLKKAKLKK